MMIAQYNSPDINHTRRVILQNINEIINEKSIIFCKTWIIQFNYLCVTLLLWFTE